MVRRSIRSLTPSAGLTAGDEAIRAIRAARRLHECRVPKERPQSWKRARENAEDQRHLARLVRQNLKRKRDNYLAEYKTLETLIPVGTALEQFLSDVETVRNEVTAISPSLVPNADATRFGRARAELELRVPSLREMDDEIADHDAEAREVLATGPIESAWAWVHGRNPMKIRVTKEALELAETLLRHTHQQCARLIESETASSRDNLEAAPGTIRVTIDALSAALAGAE